MEEKFERGVEVIVGAIIENSEKKILLGKSPKWGGKWVICGGHLESGETIEQAGLREAKEEVGLNLESSEVVSFGEMINPPDFHRPAHFIYFDILCKVGDQEVKIDGDEIQDFKWVLPEEALQMDLASGTKRGVKEYIEFLSKAKNKFV